MYNIFGITQGQKAVDLSRALPFVCEPGTKDFIDFYTWVVKGPDGTIVVDTGMDDHETKAMCTAKSYGGIKWLQEKFKQIDVDPTKVEKVIVSHLHGDHFSAWSLYPKATFYIQQKDIDFFTGPGVVFQQVSRSAAKMSDVINLAYAKRIKFMDGDEQIAPGIKAVLVGGHTPGSQIVTVTTKKGEVVLCCDALDRYQQYTSRVIGGPADMLLSLFALDTIKKLASSEDLIVPGHEPLVMKRFPNPFEGVCEIA